MARLIVDAVPTEHAFGDLLGIIQICVSVSDSETGAPVTGLTKTNFRLTSNIGAVIDTSIALCTERKWEPGDSQPSGIYELWISSDYDSINKWVKGQYYQFGVQVRIFAGRSVSSMGQTVVNVKSLGT